MNSLYVLRYASFFCTALLYAVPAYALPTGNPLPGPSGLGVIPTTDTVAPRVVEGTLLYEHVQLDAVDGHSNLLPLANVTYGLRRGELGAAYIREDSDFSGFSTKNSYFALHGKYRLFDSPRGLKAAVGAHYYDFGSQSGFDLGNVLSAYGTGSYDFRRDNRILARLHLGILYQHVNGIGNDEDVFRPYAGAEYFATPKLSVAADYLTSDKNVRKAYTLSLRYQVPTSRLGAQAGIGKIGGDTKYFVGLSYRFSTAHNGANSDAPTADAPTADAPTADAPTADAPTADAPTAPLAMASHSLLAARDGAANEVHS